MGKVPGIFRRLVGLVQVVAVVFITPKDSVGPVVTCFTPILDQLMRLA